VKQRLYPIIHKKILLFNLTVLEIYKNVKMTYIIGSVEYDNINTFLNIVSQYHKFKIKFIVTEPKVKDKNIYQNFMCV